MIFRLAEFAQSSRRRDRYVDVVCVAKRLNFLNLIVRKLFVDDQFQNRPATCGERFSYGVPTPEPASLVTGGKRLPRFKL